MAQNLIWKSGLKHGDMENGVDTSESVGKSEGKGMGSSFHKDIKGSYEFVGKLVGWSGGAEELRFDKSLLSYSEVQSWRSFCIGGALISELGFRNCRFKFLV